MISTAFTIVHNTKTGKSIPISVYAMTVSIDSIVTVDKELIAKLCGRCKNYNKKLSCPPNVGLLNKYVGAATTVDLIYWFIKTEDLELISKRSIIIMSTFSRLQKMMRRSFRDSMNMLLPGSCELCYRCSRRRGGECTNPGKCRPSPEAVGVNVIDTTKSILNIPTMWFKEGIRPLYLFNMAISVEETSEESLKDKMKNIGDIKEYDASIENLFDIARILELPDWINHVKCSI